MKCGRKKEDLWSETAKTYIYQVAAERLFNPDFLNDDDVFQDYIDQTSLTTKAIRWGQDQEEAAIRLFSTLNPEMVIASVSSCKHDTIPFFAASPDGMVYKRDGEDMMVIEVKCPNINTYMKYRSLIHDAASLKDAEPKYYWQMMAEMSCTDTKGGIFITYCPWLTKPIHWANIERNEDDVKLMEERVVLANRFIDNLITDK